MATHNYLFDVCIKITDYITVDAMSEDEAFDMVQDTVNAYTDVCVDSDPDLSDAEVYVESNVSNGSEPDGDTCFGYAVTTSIQYLVDVCGANKAEAEENARERVDATIARREFDQFDDIACSVRYNSRY